MHQEKVKNRTIFTLPTTRDTYVPILKGKGEYLPVALLMKGLKNLSQGEYEIVVYQENISGKIEGAVNFIIQKHN